MSGPVDWLIVGGWLAAIVAILAAMYTRRADR